MSKSIKVANLFASLTLKGDFKKLEQEQEKLKKSSVKTSDAMEGGFKKAGSSLHSWERGLTAAAVAMKAFDLAKDAIEKTNDALEKAIEFRQELQHVEGLTGLSFQDSQTFLETTKIAGVKQLSSIEANVIQFMNNLNDLKLHGKDYNEKTKLLYETVGDNYKTESFDKLFIRSLDGASKSGDSNTVRLIVEELFGAITAGGLAAFIGMKDGKSLAVNYFSQARADKSRITNAKGNELSQAQHDVAKNEWNSEMNNINAMNVDKLIKSSLAIKQASQKIENAEITITTASVDFFDRLFSSNNNYKRTSQEQREQERLMKQYQQQQRDKQKQWEEDRKIPGGGTYEYQMYKRHNEAHKNNGSDK